MTLTRTITFGDLKAQYDDELDDLTAAYDELETVLETEFGDDVTAAETADDKQLAALLQTRAVYDQSAQSVQKRQHLLDVLADEYGDGAFEIQVLSGDEMMAIERQLLMSDHDNQDLADIERRGLFVDVCVTDAPDGFPTDDDGSPVPSKAPQALTLALWEAAERLNNAGAADFRAPGLGDRPAAVESGTPPSFDGALRSSDQSESSESSGSSS